MLHSAQEGFQKVVHHMEIEFSRIQMGRANPLLVEDIMVEQYDSLQPLKNMASVSTLDPQTLSIKPWDRTAIGTIARAITESGKGFNPQTMADSVMIKIPPLTEERRKEMVKVVRKLSEDAKISVRNVRAEFLKNIKQQEDNKEISEDQRKDFEEKLQKEVNDTNKLIDEKAKKKSDDVMKV